MTSLNDIVNVSITRLTSAVSQAGFGTLMILGSGASFTERIRYYAGIDAVGADFASSAAEYKAANAAFSQNPKVTRVAIGRRDANNAQVFEIQFSGALSASNSFSATVNGRTIGPVAFSVDDSTTLTAIAAALQADSEIATGTAGTNKVTVTSDVGFSLTIADAAITGGTAVTTSVKEKIVLTQSGNVVSGQTISLKLNGRPYTQAFDTSQAVTSAALKAQLDADTDVDTDTVTGSNLINTILSNAGKSIRITEAKVTGTGTLPTFTVDQVRTASTELDAVSTESDDFYGVELTSTSVVDQKTASAWTESRRKVFAMRTADTAAPSSLTTDIGTFMKGKAYDRTFVFFRRPATDEYGDAAVLGKAFPFDPGSYTLEFKTLAGVSVDALTASEQGYLDGKNVNYYIAVGGHNMVDGGGKMASGEFFDTIVFVDWLQARIQEDVFAALANNPKIPYTDAGVALFQGIVQARLDEGVRVGGLAASPAPYVTVPKVATIAANDRANRYLPDIKFFGTLAGAVHKTKISGTISI